MKQIQKPISIFLSDEAIQQLDRVADKYSMTRSGIVKMIIFSKLNETGDLNGN